MKTIPIFTRALEMRYARIMRYFLGLHPKKYVIFIQKKKTQKSVMYNSMYIGGCLLVR